MKKVQVIKIIETWLSLKSDRRGVTALEYGLIAAVIASIILGGFTFLGDSLNTNFHNISNHLSVT